LGGGESAWLHRDRWVSPGHLLQPKFHRQALSPKKPLSSLPLPSPLPLPRGSGAPPPGPRGTRPVGRRRSTAARRTPSGPRPLRCHPTRPPHPFAPCGCPPPPRPPKAICPLYSGPGLAWLNLVRAQNIGVSEWGRGGEGPPRQHPRSPRGAAFVVPHGTTRRVLCGPLVARSTILCPLSVGGGGGVAHCSSDA